MISDPRPRPRRGPAPKRRVDRLDVPSLERWKKEQCRRASVVGSSSGLHGEAQFHLAEVEAVGVPGRAAGPRSSRSLAWASAALPPSRARRGSVRVVAPHKSFIVAAPGAPVRSRAR